MSFVSFMQDAQDFDRCQCQNTHVVAATSRSEDDASADDGDYEERSAGTPTRRPRSATSSRAISPAPGKETPRTSELSASPSSSRASKHDDSDESAGELQVELSSAGELSSARCLSVSNRGQQLATPSTSKKAGGKRKRAPSARYSTNKELPSWKSDHPTGVLRAPAKPMVQPQCAAPSAEPALQTIHGDNDRMQSRIELGMSAFSYQLSAAARHTPTIGDRPRPRPRFAGDRGRSPVPVPDLLKFGDQPVVVL